MPNRIIKESICSSDTIERLSWFEEVFFYRLITTCDDYGRMDARPAILKSALFPLKDSVTKAQIGKALIALATAGLVSTYTVEDKPYLQLLTWDKHQRLRNSREKYPSPENACSLRVAASCRELPRVAARAGAESESESESNPISLQDISSEQQVASEPPAAVISLADGSDYPVTREQVEKWASLYPAVDVIQELRKMIGWCDANPTKRKTKRGVLAFIARWLSRAQDSCHKELPAGNSSRASPKPTNIGNFQQREYSKEEYDALFEKIDFQPTNEQN